MRRWLLPLRAGGLSETWSGFANVPAARRATRYGPRAHDAMAGGYLPLVEPKPMRRLKGWPGFVYSIVLVLSSAALTGCASIASSTQGAASPPTRLTRTPANAASSCPVTLPNGSLSSPSPNPWYGTTALSVVLWPDGKVIIAPSQVREDGWLYMKFPWDRGVSGELTITGRRLDAPAPPVESRVPDGYGVRGFQSSGIFFPSEGCWEITGQVGETRLTFVTLVVKAARYP